MSGDKPILVTGGAGFIGSNLAHRLAGEGHRVIVYDALVREGVKRNLDWLKANHGDRIDVRVADIRDEAAMTAAVQESQAVFHMAAQVAVTTSLVDPRADYAINITGTLNVLEAARTAAETPAVIFASTNKVYGDLIDLAFDETDNGYQPVDPLVNAYGIGETRPLDFHTPYGCSKGAADQYVLDYARSYNVPSAVLRMSCIYGERQMGTEDQGWVAHFLIRALEGRTIDIYGDGHQVRDILEVSDAVDTYLALWRQLDRHSGRVFNLGGGPDNAVSLRSVLAEIETVVGRPIDLRFGDWRAGDQRYFVADRRAAEEALGLAKPADWRTGLRRLATWLSEERGLPLGTQPAMKVAI